jgi:hypothetical protein
MKHIPNFRARAEEVELLLQRLEQKYGEQTTHSTAVAAKDSNLGRHSGYVDCSHHPFIAVKPLLSLTTEIILTIHAVQEPFPLGGPTWKD